MRRVLVSALIAAFSWPGAAWALCFNFPFANTSVSDPWGCYAACGRSSPHRGVDFPRGAGTPIGAIAAGTVVERLDWDTYIGNALEIAHPDGTFSGYMHMLRPAAVSVGQWVNRGQYLGDVGNTGSASQGAHLHLGMSWIQTAYRRGSWANTFDPFAYIESHYCNCEGPCDPGQVETQACCDCGRKSRTCNASCQWGAWGGCAGADPSGGTIRCDSGKPGACAEGRKRCVNGCFSCVALREPTAESCDDIDNDCDGTTDEGSPPLGSTPPAYAAVLVDARLPTWLAPGESSDAWLLFRNVGTSAWKDRALWLRPDAVAQGQASRLAPAQGWPSVDVAAWLDHDVPPGESALFQFPIAAAAADADVVETFRLVGPSGRAIACPTGTVEVGVATVGFAAPFDEEVHGPELETTTSSTTLPAQSGWRCSAVDVGSLACWALLAVRRRSRRR